MVVSAFYVAIAERGFGQGVFTRSKKDKRRLEEHDMLEKAKGKKKRNLQGSIWMKKTGWRATKCLRRRGR